MAEPTLIAVFGSNASQSATQLIISKADMATVGLTASDTNTAESLIVAILKLAITALTDDNRDANPNQSIGISENSAPTFISRLINSTTNTYATYVRDTFSVELDKAYSGASIDPDDY